MIARLESALDRFSQERAEFQNKLEGAKRVLADYQPRIGQPFELEADLKSKEEELARLEAELTAVADDRAFSGAADDDPTAAFEAEYGAVIPFTGRKGGVGEGAQVPILNSAEDTSDGEDANEEDESQGHTQRNKNDVGSLRTMSDRKFEPTHGEEVTADS